MFFCTVCRKDVISNSISNASFAGVGFIKYIVVSEMN